MYLDFTSCISEISGIPDVKSSECLHLVVVGGVLAGFNDLTGYAGGNFMFLVGPPKSYRPKERSQTKREKLVLQEWGFCRWAFKPPKKKKKTLIISKDAQRWIPVDQKESKNI